MNTTALAPLALSTICLVVAACQAPVRPPDPLPISGDIRLEPAPSGADITVLELALGPMPTPLDGPAGRRVQVRVAVDDPQTLRASDFTLLRTPLADIEPAARLDLDPRPCLGLSEHQHGDPEQLRAIPATGSAWLDFGRVPLVVDTTEGGRAAPLTVELVHADGTRLTLRDPARGLPVWRRAPPAFTQLVGFGMALEFGQNETTAGALMQTGMNIHIDRWTLSPLFDFRFASRRLHPPEGARDAQAYSSIGGGFRAAYTVPVSARPGVRLRLGGGWSLHGILGSDPESDALSHSMMLEMAIVFGRPTLGPVVDDPFFGDAAFFYRIEPHLGTLAGRPHAGAAGAFFVLGVELAPRWD